MSTPRSIAGDVHHAVRLEYWTLSWLAVTVVVMALAMGSSQAMRTALFEDVLSLVPAIVFLIAIRYEKKSPSRRFPFGFARVNSLAFLIAATALSAVGAFLIVDAARTLIGREHPTIDSIWFGDRQVWLGWIMVAALAYSVLPPLVLGHRKLPVAQRLQDKVLYTDALMNKADWMTGLTGIIGVIGVGCGLWWADAAAAGVIALSILKDGLTALRVASAELVDGAPRALDSAALADDARALHDRLAARFPGASIRLRETGRYIAAQVIGARAPADISRAAVWPGAPDRSWRLTRISFASDEAAELVEEPCRESQKDRTQP
jgi:cobalt-zinc-cadmium efflux system protein